LWSSTTQKKSPYSNANLLKLNGPLLAAIYSGQVKKWNDPKVAALNPGLALPDQNVRALFLATPQGAVFSTTVNETTPPASVVDAEVGLDTVTPGVGTPPKNSTTRFITVA